MPQLTPIRNVWIFSTSACPKSVMKGDSTFPVNPSAPFLRTQERDQNTRVSKMSPFMLLLLNEMIRTIARPGGFVDRPKKMNRARKLSGPDFNTSTAYHLSGIPSDPRYKNISTLYLVSYRVPSMGGVLA